MTPIPSDSLVFNLAGGDMIPCAGPEVAFELAGEAAALVNPEVVQNAAAAVLHYFRHEMKRTWVSAGEFSAALEVVLHSLGLTQLRAGTQEAGAPEAVQETDLRGLVGEGMEMMFFQRLRDELRRQLAPAPRVVRFHGLRPSVMQLTGAQRWSPRCRHLQDRIVDYLRTSLQAEPLGRPCGLVVH